MNIFGVGDVTLYTAKPMIHASTIAPKNQMACAGDSGGPLLSEDHQLLGVLSFGNATVPRFQYMSEGEQCLAITTNYYIPIANYLPWIQSALKDLDAGKTDY